MRWQENLMRCSPADKELCSIFRFLTKRSS
jgi:hypothetical protein